MQPNRTISALFLAVSLCAFAAHAADKTLVTNKDVKVTDDDFYAYMERVPVELRAEAMADGERNNKVVDLIFTNRMLAMEARKSGLAQDPVMVRRAEQAVEAFLAQQYSLVLEKNAKLPNLESRAYELYLANPRQYTEPERVELQHILVNIDGRTREMARAKASELRAKALSGEDFLKLAEANSDDPGFKRNAGRLGFVSAGDIDHRLAASAFKMKANGEISEPIETQYGYHLIKRTGYQASYKRKFEDVKDLIIEEQAAKLRGEASAKHVDEIRRSPDTAWNAPAIASLRTEIPRAELDRKHKEELEKAAKQGASQDLGQAGRPGRN